MSLSRTSFILILNFSRPPNRHPAGGSTLARPRIVVIFNVVENAFSCVVNFYIARVILLRVWYITYAIAFSTDSIVHNQNT